ncbi:hypothetical protein [Actinoplanes sp. CA-252034]|uniref:hypothetical protein n=1 Tax=Actinoplanes sp. CA-252034 TaxID=3239906 RepID=UPI003D96A2F4
MWITAVGGATVRRMAWWVLLTCTVIGLASMHTLGHGRVAGSHGAHLAGGPASAPSPFPLGSSAPSPFLLVSSASSVLVAPLVGLHSVGSLVGGPAVGSPSEDHESGGGHGSAWSVCLAVLAGLTAAVSLLAWLLLRRRAGSPVGVPAFVFSAGWVIPRAPPSLQAGLRLAVTSVMRI